MINGHRLAIRIPEKMYEDLVAESAETGNAVSSIIRNAIRKRKLYE